MASDKQFDLLAKLKMDVSEYNKGVQEAKNSSKNLYSLIDESSKQIKASIDKISTGFVGISAGMAGVMGIVKSVSSIIESNQTLSDEWEKQTIAVHTAWDLVQNSISNLDFTNLFNNIRTAYIEGAKYAEVLDLLEDKERGHNIAVSEAALRLEELKVIYQNVNLSENKRQVALDEAKKIETDLAKQETTNKKQLFEATKQLILNTRQLSEEELMGFVSFKDGYDKKVELAQKYNDKVKELSRLQSKQTSSAGPPGTQSIWDVADKNDGARILQLKKEINSTNEQTVKLSQVLLKVGDSQVKQLADQYIAYNIAQAAEVGNIATLEKRYNMLQSKEDRRLTGQEALNKAKKEEEERVNRITDSLLTYADISYKIQQNAKAIAGERDNGLSMPNLAGTDVAFKAADKRGESVTKEETPDEIWKHYNDIVKQTLDANRYLGESFVYLEKHSGTFAASMVEVAGSIQKSAINGAKSMSELANSAIETARRIIAAKISEGITSAIVGALESVPFPFNIAIATMAASTATTLFNSLVPKFATGGIVPGTSYTGDMVYARVNSGEMILNAGEQANLFRMINSGMGGFPNEIKLRAERGALVAALEYDMKRDNLFR